MTDTFDHFLDVLVDQDTPIQLEALAYLSDLSREESNKLEQVWYTIPLVKRQSIVNDVGTLANEDITLNFDALNRIALADSDPFVRKKSIENLSQKIHNLEQN